MGQSTSSTSKKVKTPYQEGTATEAAISTLLTNGEMYYKTSSDKLYIKLNGELHLITHIEI